MKKLFVLFAVAFAMLGCNKIDNPKQDSLAGTSWTEVNTKDYHNVLSFDSSTVCRMTFVASNGASSLDATGKYTYENGRVEFDMKEGKDLFGIETIYQYGIVSGDTIEVYYQYGTASLHSMLFKKDSK